MKRDAAIPALAALLALLALPVTGLAAGTRLPSTPQAYYPLALGLCALFFIAIGPARRGEPLRPLRLALAAAPFLVFAVHEGAGGAVGGWPSFGWFAALGAGSAVALADRRRLLLGAGLAVLLGGGAVLAAAGLPVLPRGWNAFQHPLPPAAASAAGSPQHADERAVGVRRGAPVSLPAGRTPALGQGPGPWWVRAAVERSPGPRPVVVRLAPRGGLGLVPPTGALTVVDLPADDAVHAFDLEAGDAVVAREDAWSEDDPRAEERALAVVGFVRGGGLLIGPAPERPWPPPLGRLLGGAGRGTVRGVAGVRRLGLGRVARAGTQADAEEVLEAGLWVPEVESALGGRAHPPLAPTALKPWRDEPAGRRPIGILLLAYVGALATLAWLRPRPGAHLLGLVLVAGAVSGAVAWLSPRAVGHSVHGLVLDLGGPGGRRFEAVWISAGPRGFCAPVRFAGGGVVSLEGAALTPAGEVRVPPGRSAWVVRERVGLGVLPEDVEDRHSAWLRPLLLGEADPARLRYGRVPVLPVHVPGMGAIPAASLTYAPPDA